MAQEQVQGQTKGGDTKAEELEKKNREIIDLKVSENVDSISSVGIEILIKTRRIDIYVQ